MKRTLVVLPALLALALLAGFLILRTRELSAVPTFIEGLYTYTVTNGTATITSVFRSESDALSVTNTLGGYPVTAIGHRAFDECWDLTSVTIPAGITTIGTSAFSGCIGLTHVTIPASVTNIGTAAFSRCRTLGRAYFVGNAPSAEPDVFRSTPVTVYYRPDTAGWRSTYCGRPTAVWNPEAPRSAPAPPSGYASRRRADDGVLSLFAAADRTVSPSIQIPSTR